MTKKKKKELLKLSSLTQSSLWTCSTPLHQTQDPSLFLLLSPLNQYQNQTTSFSLTNLRSDSLLYYVSILPHMSLLLLATTCSLHLPLSPSTLTPIALTLSLPRSIRFRFRLTRIRFTCDHLFSTLLTINKKGFRAPNVLIRVDWVL